LFKNGRCVKHYESTRARRHDGAVAACCGRLGRLKVEYYLELKKVAALAEAPEADRAEARDMLKRIFNEEVQQLKRVAAAQEVPAEVLNRLIDEEVA
jgi:hypothetical protein